MKRKTVKLFALLLSFVFVCSFAACGKSTVSETTAQANVTTNSTTAVQGTTAPNESTTAAETQTGETQTSETQTGNVSTTAAADNGLPTTKSEILAAYTAVMNKAKTDKPGYTKIMYQSLPDAEKYKDNTTVKILMSIVNLFMTTKDKAMKNPVVYENGSDTKANFPITESTKGCMLTNTNAIKSASCAALPDGNYKITIILNNELNPERFRDGMIKAPSNTGNMFVIFSKSDVDPILQKPYVKILVKNGDLQMNFHDCKAELEYNPKTNRIISLDQVTHTSLGVSGTVVGHYYKENTELEMYYTASNFKY